MTQTQSPLKTHATIRLNRGADWLQPIIDRLNSYETHYTNHECEHYFKYAFGEIILDERDNGYFVSLHSDEEIGLNRLKDLAAVAIKLYTKEEEPDIFWEGDCAGEQTLPQFRLMKVVSVYALTPHMLRVRLQGDDLKRFSLFGAMHVRLLLPTKDIPQPVWPLMGRNGLPLWPDEARKPVPRAYTIRKLNIDEGWLDIDFYVHETEGLACNWAKNAKSGDIIGLMGPVGRPLRQAKTYIIGADSTGLPAIGRMLEEFTPDVTGHVIIAVDTEADIQTLTHPKGIQIEWLVSDNQEKAAQKLTQKLCALPWPEGADSFGWFAGEAEQAKIIRDYWRKQLGKNRDQTLVAGYWQKDATGFMAG